MTDPPLPYRYLFPFNPHGFGDHVNKFSRPIIVHGTAKSGKMIKGEAELRLVQTGELASKPAQVTITITRKSRSTKG